MGLGLLDFCVYFYVLALLLKRKAGRRKPDGTAYQPKIECSAPEKPLQQMTGVGQVNMIFFRFKPTPLFLFFFFSPSCEMQFCSKGYGEEGQMGEDSGSKLQERPDNVMFLICWVL